MADAMLYQREASGQLIYLYDWDNALLCAVSGPEEAVGYVPPAKLGYDFAGWVAVSPDTVADTWTAFESLEEYAAAAWNGTETEALKAAYVKNSTCDTDADGLRETRYTLGEVECRVSDTYSRDTYVLLVPVFRRNEFGNGTTKRQDLILRVNSKVADRVYFTPVPLSDSDEQTSAVFLTGALYTNADDTVTLDVTTGWSSWSTGGALSKSIILRCADIKYTAHLHLINDLGMQAAQAAVDGTDVPRGWPSIHLSYAYVGLVLPDGVTNGGSRNLLLKAYQTCITTGDGLPFTVEQMQYVINNNGAWISAAELGG